MEKLEYIVVKLWYSLLKSYARLVGTIRFNSYRPRELNRRHEVGLLSFTKNEGSFILEWLIYHLQVLKIDHIVLIDNNETLGDYTMLSKDLRKCVTIIHDATVFNGVKTQIKLINKYFKIFAKEFKWFGVIDTDEFIYFNRNDKENLDLKSWLMREKNINICYLYWRFYGPADLDKFRDSRSILLSSELRAAEDYPPHFQYKSLLRTDSFFCFFGGPHEPLMFGGAKSMKASGFLNHYYFRTEEFFELKRKRRLAAFGYKDSDFSFDQNIIACSQVKTEDERFMPYRTRFKEYWLAN